MDRSWTSDSQIVCIVSHAGDSHLENSNEGHSKLMEWLLIILLMGDWRLLRLHLRTSYNTRRWPQQVNGMTQSFYLWGTEGYWDCTCVHHTTQGGDHSKLMEWLLIILLMGDWRLLRLHLRTSYNTRRLPQQVNGMTLNHSTYGGLKAIETALAYIIQHKEVTTAS